MAATEEKVYVLAGFDSGEATKLGMAKAIMARKAIGDGQTTGEPAAATAYAQLLDAETRRNELVTNQARQGWGARVEQGTAQPVPGQGRCCP